MFKQITNLNGDETYLIGSLLLFIVFFVVVAMMLFFMKKDFVHYMKELPLQDDSNEVNP